MKRAPGVPLSPEQGGGKLLNFTALWQLADQHRNQYPEAVHPQTR